MWSTPAFSEVTPLHTSMGRSAFSHIWFFMFLELTKLSLILRPLPLPFLETWMFFPLEPQIFTWLVPSCHSDLRPDLTNRHPLVKSHHLPPPSDIITLICLLIECLSPPAECQHHERRQECLSIIIKVVWLCLTSRKGLGDWRRCTKHTLRTTDIQV